MSWCMARYSVMTKIFSPSRVSRAGRELGILMGMGSASLFEIAGERKKSLGKIEYTYLITIS